MVRTGFGMILGAEPDIEVVAEARDGVEAVAEARRTKPDVALMDIRMPRMDGLEALKQIANDVRVVVCTTFDHDEYVHTALKNGACGFLLKDAGSNLLIEEGQEVKAGAILCQWDPHSIPILAEVGGKVRYEDVIQGETMRLEKDPSGHQRRLIMEHKGDLHPQVVLEDSSGKILDFYYLPEKATSKSAKAR